MNAQEIIQYIADSVKKTPVKLYVKEREPIDYGEASVKPLDFITLNCGDVACKEFDKLLAGMQALGGVTRTAAQVAKDY